MKATLTHFYRRRVFLFFLVAACEAAPPAVEVSPPTARAGAASSMKANETSDAGAKQEIPDAALLKGGQASSSVTAQPSACPMDMVHVAGNYCPTVQQKCLEHHPEYVRDQERRKKFEARGDKAPPSSVSERCMRYRRPSVCLSKRRRPMDFCIDRYEWPNQKGEKPMALVSWHDAVRSCKRVGKRLCTVAEFNFACEGEEMLPYTYGYERDAEKCNIDRPYRRRRRNFYRFENCMKNEKCRAEFERLDQREPLGAREACRSPFGVYDLNGNINEWVRRPRQKAPNRSGLKSGWWGPVRGRCRPTVGFHKEADYGYEVGFRCCREAERPPSNRQ